MSIRKYPDWVVTGGAPGDAGHCQRCGESLHIHGLKLKAAANAVEKFCRVHAKCAPRQQLASQQGETPHDQA